MQTPSSQGNAKLYFANVTAMNAYAWGWLVHNAGQYAHVGLVETHTLSKDIGPSKRKLQQLGFKSQWIASRDTGHEKGGGQAGVVSLAPKHLHVSHAIEAGAGAIAACSPCNPMEMTDWCFAILNLRGPSTACHKRRRRSVDCPVAIFLNT